MKQFEYYQMERPELADLVPKNAIKILDVGCGAGGLGRSLLNQNPSREMYGIEMVENAAEKAREVYKDVLVGELGAINFTYPEDFFDVIIFADVLEHLVDPWALLKELRNYLNDEGVVVSSIPNVAHWSIFGGLFQGEWNYIESGILDKTHLRFFTKKSIQVLHRNTGFTINHLGGKSVGANPLNLPAFHSGLQSIGINSEQCLAESDVFQYLTVAKKTPVFENTNIILLADGNISKTKECFEALEANTKENIAEIILVVNKEYETKFHNEFNGINVLYVDEKTSFSERVNAALEDRKGKYLCILKNNVFVTPHWLENLLECMISADDIAMVGPLSASVEGDQNLENITLGSKHEVNTFAERLFYKLINTWTETNKLASFCLLIRADKYREAGGFNRVLKNERTAVASLGNKLQGNGSKLVIAQDVFVSHLPLDP